MAKNKPGESDVRYEVITQEDPETGDIILPIPEPVLKQMGWKEGDELDISVDSDGKLFIKKK
jgi:AbrB family looped-hinge helix DNA binding protein